MKKINKILIGLIILLLLALCVQDTFAAVIASIDHMRMTVTYDINVSGGTVMMMGMPY